MPNFNLTYSEYVNRKYREFYEKHGYIPKYFNPYNCREITDVHPTLLAEGERITSSGRVLIAEYVEDSDE